LVFDHAARIQRRLVEIDDGGVLRSGRVKFAPSDAVNPQIVAGLAEFVAIGKYVNPPDIELGDGQYPAAVNRVSTLKRLTPQPSSTTRWKRQFSDVKKGVGRFDMFGLTRLAHAV